MSRFALVIALALLPLWSAWADYRSGVAAWGRGDYAAAARAFRPVAEAGDAEAQYMMGRLYSLGDGVPRDFIAAWRWFDRAARAGHAEAATARQALDHVLTPGQLAQARGAPPSPARGAPPSPQVVAVPSAPVASAPVAPVAIAEAPMVRPLLLVPRRGGVVDADQQQAAR